MSWLAAIILPPLALVDRRDGNRGGCINEVSAPCARSGTLLLGHGLASIALLVTLHAGYRALFASLAGGSPSYQRADGLFLLAAWAPLVDAADFPDPALGRTVLERSKCALRDRRSREGQRWSQGCLVSRLEEIAGNSVAANAIARATTLGILRRDPGGVSRLALASWLDFFDGRLLAEVMRWDRSPWNYPDRVNQLLETRFELDGKALPHLWTPSNLWYFRSEVWLEILALSPLLACLAWLIRTSLRRPGARQCALVAGVATGLMAITAVAATSPIPRYLHPLGWLAAIWMAELLSSFGPARDVRASRQVNSGAHQRNHIGQRGGPAEQRGLRKSLGTAER
jgi:hypothetical protein